MSTSSGREDEVSCRTYVAFLLLFTVCIHIMVFTSQPCYLELFVDSVSVSARGWNVSMAARSYVKNCRISITPLYSRFLLGDMVIAESLAKDSFQNLPADEGFATTVVDKLNGGSGDVVYRDSRMKLFAHVWKTGGRKTGNLNNGLLSVTCDNFPMRFWSDPEGNRKGSLLGNMSRCDSLYRPDLAKKAPVVSSILGNSTIRNFIQFYIF